MVYVHTHKKSLQVAHPFPIPLTDKCSLINWALKRCDLPQLPEVFHVHVI